MFGDLVDTGSFSRAAAMNGVTQSAVSQQVRALETRFGVALIERGSGSRREFGVTAEGRAFLQASREILAAFENLGHRIRELGNVVAGPLRVAAVPSIGMHELPPLLKRFRGLFPEVEVSVDYRRSARVYAEVFDGRADLGLVAYPSRRRGLAMESFWRDRLVLICHPEHPLSERRGITLGDLAGERFIGFEPDLPTRKHLDRVFREAGVTIRQVMEGDSIETVKRAVRIEEGVSIVPRTTVRDEVAAGTLRAVEIEHSEMWRPLGVLYRKGRTLTPAGKQFLTQLKETTWAESGMTNDQ